MTTREYRIILPFSLEEYRRAQLYMVAKASRVHSTGGEGVEIAKNEPFDDPVQGKGQFTHKIFHVSSRIPYWMTYVIPAGMLTFEEKCWNAYPYVKTEYSCALFGERFNMSIETKYLEGPGEIDIWADKRGLAEFEIVNIVTDPVTPAKYKQEEDPTLYHSEKSNRGPLKPDWVSTQQPIMCSYKLCKINFAVWGLQTSVESYLSGFLREIFVLGHRQAFCWTDEWWDLTMEDIRKYEDETQKLLAERMKPVREAELAAHVPTTATN